MSTINTTKSAMKATRNAMVSTLNTTANLTKKTVQLPNVIAKQLPTAVKNSWNALPEETKVGATFIGAEVVSVAAANVCNYAAGKSTNPKMVKCFTNGKKYYSALALGFYFIGEGVMLYGALKDYAKAQKEIKQCQQINADIAQMSEETTAKAIHPSFDHDVQPDYKLDEDEVIGIDHDQF